MAARPPFERYPGQRPDEADVYRVISPYRDALAWVSIAGKLSLLRFMVREGAVWQTLVDAPPQSGAEDAPSWAFAWRDPVELAFISRPAAGVEVMAYVTVTRSGCEVHLEPGEHAGLVRGVIAGEQAFFRVLPY